MVKKSKTANGAKARKRPIQTKQQDAATCKAAKELRARHLASLCAEVESLRGANGRIPRGALSQVLQINKAVYSWLTVDILKKSLKKRNECDAKPGDTSVINTTIISDLTESDQSNGNPPDCNIPPPAIVGTTTTNVMQDITNESRKRGGRPKGATIVASQAKAKQTALLIEEITSEWSKRVEGKENNKRMKKSELDTVISEKKVAFQLTDVEVTKSCIRQRLKKKIATATHCGTPSPIAAVEDYIVSILQQMAKMRQPLNVSEGLSLANALVEGTEWEEKVTEFKMKRGWKPYGHDGKNKPVLGPKWYKGFFKRHAHILEKKKGQKFSKDRSEWSIYRNFVQMYDEVYKAMETAGVAVRLAEEIWVNKDQEETTEELAFGRKATHILTRPDYVIFVDEVGSNTSQEGDGALGGEKKIVGRGLVPRESAATNDSHFTVLGFTAATGEPIMCALILEGKVMRPEVITGLDLFTAKEGDENDADFVSRNTGKGKMYPCGPVCNFKGKQVPCMVSSTDSGSITSELLASFLEYMDKLELFPRIDGLKPFLLLDGHGSRLELPFLQYVNDDNHRWIVCIGVPYGTSYWQVGDSSEQNGSYKMALTRSKKELVLKKQRACFSHARIETYEIIIVLNAAWEKSFGRTQFNKEAIAARGWYPLTRNLLDHPEIIATAEALQEDATTAASSTEPPSTIAASLNYRNGFASTVMADILQNIDREAVRQQIRNNQQEGEQALANLAAHKKLSAGAVFKAGKAWLGPDVLEAQLERKRLREEKEQQQQNKQMAEMEKKRKAYEKALEEVSNLPPTRWTVSQLWALIAYKKRKDDKWPQLKSRGQMMEVWEKIKDRIVEHTLAPQEIQPPEPTRDAENEASAALLSLIGNPIEGDDDDTVIQQIMV
jgi:hypothetical protein